MIKRFSILSLLLVLLTGASVQGTPHPTAPDHAKIVHSDDSSRASTADQHSTFGLVPIEHQTEKETPQSREISDTTASDDAQYIDGSRRTYSSPVYGESAPNGVFAKIIAIDRTSRTLFPFHSFL